MTESNNSMAETLANAQKKLDEKKERQRQHEILTYGHVLSDKEKAYYAEQMKKAELEEKRQKEQVLRQKRINNYFENWIKTVPKKYKEASFENAYTNTNQRKFIVEEMKKCNSAIISGDNGLGKTYLGYACCRKMIKEGKKARIITAYKMFNEIKSRFSTNSDEEYKDELKKLDLLIIDEADKKYGSTTDFLNLSEIVSDREAEDLPTIILTNADIIDLPEVLGSSVVDRISGGDGKIIEMTGKSLRQRDKP